ncbi:dTDP-4-amino-4,6-dideoxygalactose transaminase [Algoriphagus faecimaris]|uniref:dTDP-4-amino-4,6-dideoxygalactose transaminase n=1 Tax=Algoriphagus faecimaris TaxID=686796 RepID=A0A1G6PT65_9BACT|nr:dTDP-4-amino-4,6-dideoxygalactose transaminase [Algoriphagus faecimaris]SDC83412.1 dTDP-4-amino-4,6-dideoxygalactose transaminase [Algoriphagus faecimaris]
MKSPAISIPFNKPFLSGQEFDLMRMAAEEGKLSGNGHFTQLCHTFFEAHYDFGKCFLTTSCTDALEMAALLLDLQPGDEVILPSFTFVSTANAFAIRGAKLRFVDSRPGFPGMDESQVEQLINENTRAIVAVHYGGVPCQMSVLKELAEKHQVVLIEDAAQAIDSYFEGKALGSFGQLSTFSFHETKNVHCGEGGMLIVNEPSLIKRAEILWEKGTDRAAMFRGEIDKYGWKDLGSSFLLSELQAAFLYAQLKNLDKIQARRRAIWEDYSAWFSEESKKEPALLSIQYLKILEEALAGLGNIEFQSQPGNYHLFYLLFENASFRQEYIQRLKEKGILAVFHYQCLHQSEFIQKNQPEEFQRDLPNAQGFSDCLLRLPLFYELPSFEFPEDRVYERKG